MEDLTGKQLGPYQVIAPLGEGGMAAVYKAYHAAMDRYVAVKVLPQQLAKSDPQFVGRFTQEARVLAKLQHPHILPVFDFGEAGGYTYLVMPLVETGTLKDLLHGKPLPLKQIRSIVSQVGDALDYAHTRGLVHRDVKPSNVLVDERGNCLLADFGIAKMVEGTAHFTSTGGMLGTPAYMSPEQGRSAKVDARSDIYTLGVLLFEMATGRVPFDAETPIAVVLMHISDPLPLPRKLNPDLPESVERVILKSLAKDPDDRYQRASAMVEGLQHAIDEFEHAKPTIAAEAFATIPEAVAAPERVEKEVRPYAKPTLMPEPRRRALPTGALLALLVGIMVVGGLSVAALFALRPAGLPASSTPAKPTEFPTRTSTVVTAATRTPALTSTIALSWDFSQDGEGWARLAGFTDIPQYNDIKPIHISNGLLITRSIGDDPYMLSAAGLEIDASAAPLVAIRMSISAGEWAAIYFITDRDADWGENKSMDFPVTSDGEFYDYVIDMSEVPRWRGTVTQLRLDPTDTDGADIEIDFIRAQSR